MKDTKNNSGKNNKKVIADKSNLSKINIQEIKHDIRSCLLEKCPICQELKQKDISVEKVGTIKMKNLLFNNKISNKKSSFVKNEIVLIFLWISLWSLVSICVDSIQNKKMMVMIKKLLTLINIS
jgi:hypothetical protein